MFENYTIYISGVQVSIEETTLNIQKIANQRSVCSFNVLDATGLPHYYKGESVLIIDTAGNIFKGYIDKSMESLVTATNTTMRYLISCIDMQWCADKRIVIKAYTNMYAGDMLADIAKNYLQPEGVLTCIAYDRDVAQADFGSGVLTGTVATPNGLQISQSGSNLSIVTASTTNWNAGTFVGTQANTNSIGLASYWAIRFEAKCKAPAIANSYVYYKIWAGSYTIQSGDTLTYDIWYDSRNPMARGGVDAVCTDGTTFRDYGGQALVDQNGMASHPNTDMTGYTDYWYSRQILLTPIAGKVISYFTVAQEGNNAGDYVFFTKNILIKNGASTSLTVYGNTSTTNTFAIVSNANYTIIEHKTYVVYVQTGTWTSAATSLSTVGLIQSSYVSMVSSTPTNTFAFLYVSIDGGVTWDYIAPGNNYVPSLLPGLNVSAQTIQYQVQLSYVGSDPRISVTTYLNPLISNLLSVSNITLNIISALSATKSDFIKTWGTQANWNTGTSSNTINTAANQVALNGVYRSWDDGVITNQTLINSAGSPAQAGSVVTKNYKLTVATGNQIRADFDFAGQWANFVACIDMITPPASTNVQPGFFYRTTSVNSTFNTFAYCMGISNTNIFCNRGSNSTTNSIVLLANATHNIPANTNVCVRVECNASNLHTQYVDDILYNSFTDATFTAAGYMGAYLSNGSGVTQSVYFDNFAVVAAKTGTWISAAQSPGNITVDNSIVLWSNTLPYGSTLLVEASINGGSNYYTCTNGAVIPNLAHGNVLSSPSLLIRATLTCTNPNFPPTLNGLSVFVASAYSASGQRVSAALALDPVVRAGSSNVFWNATLPTNTTVTTTTSVDGGSTYQAITSGNAISNINLEPSAYVDYADYNSSANYTSSGSWAWDTTNRLINGTGLSSLAYTTYSIYDSGFVEWDTYASDEGGAFINGSDVNNMYCVILKDNSSAYTPGNISLSKVVAGVWTVLASAPISVARSVGTRFRFVKDRTKLTVNMGATQVLTYTDGGTLLPASYSGVFSAGGTLSIGSIRIQPYGDYVVGKTVLVKQVLTSLDATVTPVVTNVTTSVRDDKIDAGPLITEATFNYVTATDSIKALATLANTWYSIDANGYQWFKARYAISAPFLISRVNQDTLPTVTSSNPMYRNTEYVLGQALTSVQYKETFGDGASTQWVMNFVIALAPIVHLNTVNQTVGVKGIDTGVQFYWANGDINLYIDSSHVVLQPTDVIEVWYQGYFDNVVIVQNYGEIAGRKVVEGGGTGIVEAVDAATVTSPTSAYQFANGQLQYYGYVGQSLTFRVDQGGLSEGMVLTANIPEHGVVNEQFVIESVTITDEESYLWYDVVCTNGPITNTWVQAFQSMAPTTTVDKLNVGTGTIAQVATAPADTVTWGEGVATTVYACFVPSATTYCGASLICC
jgi:hypothetical protein